MTLGERRTRVVRASAARTWTVVEGVGGPAGWYAFTRLWRFRAALDRLAGGPGMRGRPDRPLRAGDVVDFWVVEAIDPGRSLTLRAQMRMPGTARMTLTVTPCEAGVVRHPSASDSTDTASTVGCHLTQVITFAPRGVAGRLYWYTQLPAHRVVFAAMLRGMARAAERG
ncbi:hypothetical protein BKD30_14920 [Tersicoccus phoenicis]|uniref:DUF2867 domain-containing protein n=1 Tax=Tersicoccus phoenicis TaxID=554083 RepID=A0A1R1L617_9MICC|nr:DUF2867 domain-containing protein [Tersicoccus phoenicis]OMH22995.1 hypothetical protein BKD30_14920 [Tersicoccus phoenicis]